MEIPLWFCNPVRYVLSVGNEQHTKHSNGVITPQEYFQFYIPLGYYHLGQFEIIQAVQATSLKPFLFFEEYCLLFLFP